MYTCVPNSQVFRMKAADNSPGAVLIFADRGHRFMVQFDSKRFGCSYHSPFADKSSADKSNGGPGAADTGGQRRTTADNVLSLLFSVFSLRHFQTALFSHIYCPCSGHSSIIPGEATVNVYSETTRLQMFQKRPFFCCRNFEAKRLRRHILLGPPDLFCSKTFFSVTLNARHAVGILGETLVQLG